MNWVLTRKSHLIRASWFCPKSWDFFLVPIRTHFLLFLYSPAVVFPSPKNDDRVREAEKFCISQNAFFQGTSPFTEKKSQKLAPSSRLLHSFIESFLAKLQLERSHKSWPGILLEPRGTFLLTLWIIKSIWKSDFRLFPRPRKFKPYRESLRWFLSWAVESLQNKVCKITLNEFEVKKGSFFSFEVFLMSRGLSMLFSTPHD